MKSWIWLPGCKVSPFVWLPLLLAAFVLTAAQGTDNGDPIEVGDLLFVNVHRNPQLSTTAQVDPNGNINLAYIGSIPVMGLTEAEATARVSMELTKIIKNPRVKLSRSAGAMSGPVRAAGMQTELIPLQNASARQLSEDLAGASSEDGSVSFSEETNTLIVTDTPDVIKNIMTVATRLDRMETQRTQVQIETKIAEVRVGAMKELGIRWFVQGDDAGGGYYPPGRLDPDLQAIRGVQRSGLDNERLSGRADSANVNNTARRFVDEPNFDRRLQIPVQVPTEGQMFFSLLTDGIDLGVMLDALIADNKAELLADPMVVAVNHKPAHIRMVDEFPYSEIGTTAGGFTQTVTKFLDLGVKLDVTPHVMSTGDGTFVRLELEPEVSYPSGSASGVPIRSVRSRSGEMIVRDGQSLAIGGIFRNDDRNVDRRVPGFGDIPILGRFFRNTEDVRVRTELMVFVTPTVHRSPDTIAWERVIDIEDMDASKPLTPRHALARERRKD